MGFSPVSRVYKVLRIYSRFTLIGAQIHDVRRSNNSWRDVESTTPLDDCIYKDNSYAFMNGIGYWLCLFGPPRVANFIVFFDFESEVFGRIDAPPSFDEYRLKHLHLMSIGVLRDCLCLIDNTESLDIWMLNECGQWIKQFSSVHVVDNPLFQKRLRPLQLLREILMVSNDGNLFCATQGCSNGKLRGDQRLKMELLLDEGAEYIL
ncbi:hypothetical protein BUALT_Bualt19G0087100 [Buddleja alternifolia]|uniref:F-box associated beta-propeller type 1 domain-containing protein n=1 Tax=Buddleja alternifolia TaxID=168488 RepID=A0AAV6W1W8_9LAMI|nr:hypothetical protein BUALT_Bualt19G0087100 [Buddleja alternifolia]